jgi:hypothetical protein
MSDLTDYAETVFRDWLSQGTSAPTPPDPLYVSLHTADPGESPDGSTEVSATQYSRQDVVSADWNTLAPGDVSSNGHGFENAINIQFNVANSDWGTVTHVALWNGTQNTDNAYASFALDSSRTINSGDQAQFAAGNLSFVID